MRSRRSADLLALISVASVQPRFSVARAVAAVEAMGGPEAGRVLANQRARGVVLSRLEPFADSSAAVRECCEILRPGGQRMRDMQAALPENLRRLEWLAATCGIEVFTFKGMGARQMYADPAIRDFGDLDLFVRSRADATRLSRRLRHEFGYSYHPHELPWLKYDAGAQLVYGQICLLAPDGGSGLHVDLHFGDYSVRHCGRLGLADALPRRPAGVHVMAPEENLACMVNNSAGDYYITAKDLNDLLMALSLPSFDIARFAAPLRRSNLTGFLGFLVTRLRRVAVLTPQQEAGLRAMPVTRTLEPVPELDGPHWRQRCLGTTMHAFGIGRSRGLRSALRIAANAYRYYRRPLRLAVAAGSPGANPEVLDLNPWTCVRLVPLDLAQSLAAEHPVEPALAAGAEALRGVRTAAYPADPGIERSDTRAGSFVHVDGETFVATVSYRLPAELVWGARLLSSAAGPR